MRLIQPTSFSDRQAFWGICLWF